MMRISTHFFISPGSAVLAGSLFLVGSAGLLAQSLAVNPVSHAPVHVMQGPVPRAITLDLDEAARPQNLMDDSKPALPANFRQFAAAGADSTPEVQTLTLRFHSTATLNHLEGTDDFRVVQGGSCTEGHAYLANSACTVMVQFTPQGPGHRFGKLAVTNSTDATPLYVGLGGYGSAPAISFTPSIINTVPGTYVSNAGLLSGANQLAVDGGDTVYIADTGNQQVRYYPSSGGALQTIVNGFGNWTDPQGIAVDSLGGVFVSQDNPVSVIYEVPYGSTEMYAGGSTSCGIGTTCDFSGAPLYHPGGFASDVSGNIFLFDSESIDKIFNDSTSVFDFSYIPLEFQFSGQGVNSLAPTPIAVDASDTLYEFYGEDGCFISANPYYEAASDSYSQLTTIAGGRNCGFGGDGGQARGALIGALVSQMTFDQAGNFYFTDTVNQRVRRIDALTGTIQTIAGTGTAGYTGDSGPSTSATLASPTGLTVDSKGQVYIVSSATATGTKQVLRVITTTGRLSFPVSAVNTTSAAQIVEVSNTGNAALNFTNTGFSSGNSADFAVNPLTTSCNFTQPLASGASCNLGFTFKPTAVGLRAAYFTMTDNTVTKSNTIYIAGIGATTATLTPSAIAFAGTTVGSSATAQTATLTNTGSAVLTISSIAISGTGKTSYSFTDTCASTLAVGAKCTITVGFKPTVAGSLSANLVIVDNATTANQMVTLSGAGIAPAITTPTKPKQPPATIVR